METIIKTTLIGLFFGTFGTTIGGIIGIKFKNPSNKFLSFILSFASGLMIAIVCFELIPEAMQIASIGTVLLGIIIGIVAMFLCDIYVDKKFHKSNISNNLLKTGIIVSIGLAIHNFPEGLAIGSGFEASIKLGLSLAIAICLHDIPEGIFQSRHYKKCLINNLNLYLIHIYRTCNRQVLFLYIKIVLSRKSLKNNVYDQSSYSYWVRARLLLRGLFYLTSKI